MEKFDNTIPWQHSHIFDDGNPLAERNTRWAVWLTAITMVVEIAGGWIYNSMALLADGWHMSSHAMALGLSVLAYGAARRLAHSKRFAFGTWKIEILGGYTSAILLVGVAGLMLFQSVERLLAPSPIHYDQAILIAMVGLLVNLTCAWLLKDGHAHHHGTDSHDSHHHHHDLNLRSAYLHVMTDAATSLLAIVALFGGKLAGPGNGYCGCRPGVRLGLRAFAGYRSRASGCRNGCACGGGDTRCHQVGAGRGGNIGFACLASREGELRVHLVARGG